MLLMFKVLITGCVKLMFFMLDVLSKLQGTRSKQTCEGGTKCKASHAALTAEGYM